MIRRQFVSDLNPKQVRSKQLGFKGSQASVTVITPSTLCFMFQLCHMKW
jgi:hypothetical protein